MSDNISMPGWSPWQGHGPSPGDGGFDARQLSWPAVPSGLDNTDHHTDAMHQGQSVRYSWQRTPPPSGVIDSRNLMWPAHTDQPNTGYRRTSRESRESQESQDSRASRAVYSESLFDSAGGSPWSAQSQETALANGDAYHKHAQTTSEALNAPLTQIALGPFYAPSCVGAPSGFFPLRPTTQHGSHQDQSQSQIQIHQQPQQRAQHQLWPGHDQPVSLQAHPGKFASSTLPIAPHQSQTSTWNSRLFDIGTMTDVAHDNNKTSHEFRKEAKNIVPSGNPPSGSFALPILSHPVDVREYFSRNQTHSSALPTAISTRENIPSSTARAENRSIPNKTSSSYGIASAPQFHRAPLQPLPIRENIPFGPLRRPWPPQTTTIDLLPSPKRSESKAPSSSDPAKYKGLD